MDTVKYIVAFLILAAGIFAFNQYQDYSDLIRVGGIILVFLAAIGILLTTAKGKYVWALISQARNEARKVVWPTPKETNTTTLIVIVAVFVVGLILWLIDSLLVMGMRLVTGG